MEITKCCSLQVVAHALLREACPPRTLPEITAPAAGELKDAIDALLQLGRGDESVTSLHGDSDAPATPEMPIQPAQMAAGGILAATLSRDIDLYLSLLSPLLESDRSYQKATLGALRDCIAEALPGASVALFGSRAAGLHLPGGDVDALLRTAPGAAVGESVAEILQDAASVIRSRKLAHHGRVLRLLHVRVPLLRFAVAPQLGGLRVDLSAQTGPGSLQAAEWTTAQCRAQPLLRPLVLVLKRLLHQGGLADASVGGLGGHALVNLVAAFLWDQSATRGGSALSPGEALLGILDLYGRRFDYEAFAVDCSGAESGRPCLVPLEAATLEGWPAARAGNALARGKRVHVRCPVTLSVDVAAPCTRIGAVATLFSSTLDLLRGPSGFGALDGHPAGSHTGGSQSMDSLVLLAPVLGLGAWEGGSLPGAEGRSSRSLLPAAGKRRSSQRRRRGDAQGRTPLITL